MFGQSHKAEKSRKKQEHTIDNSRLAMRWEKAGRIFTILSLPAVPFWGVAISVMAVMDYIDDIRRSTDLKKVMRCLIKAFAILLVGVGYLGATIFMALHLVPLPFVVGGAISCLLSIFAFLKADTMKP